MPAERILFVPEHRRGEGSGHMRRCARLAAGLVDSVLIIPDDGDSRGRTPAEWKELIGDEFPDGASVRARPDDSAAASGDTDGENGFVRGLAVLDRRSSDRAALSEWGSRWCAVLLDDDGPARKQAPFVIDTIPGHRSTPANISSPRLLELPPRSREPSPDGPVLVSFGGDDPAGLTAPVLRVLADLGYSRESLHAAGPPDRRDAIPVGLCRFIGAPNLKERLGTYGLVVTSYGLTAWEAIAAGCAVLTVDPTPYHALLSRSAGFPGLGVPRKGASGPRVRFLRKRLARHLTAESGKAAISAAARILADRLDNSGKDLPEDLASLIGSLEAPRPGCAACSALLPPVIHRFPYRSYYRCPRCGMTGLYRFKRKEDEYGPAYFQQEYQAQYGRSYLDDFDAIRTMARPRLSRILRRARPSGTLLDVGCAYGPFLAAAAEAGFRPFGTDVSEEGVAHVRNNLGFSAVSGHFPADDPAAALGVEAFDVVTLWYVIEHFPRLDIVLDALSSLVRDGGVLALSTPNAAGISARRSFRRFLERSPRDHYTLWTPRTARALLNRHGFRVYSIRITGHHPERFPGRPGPRSPLYILYNAVSRWFGLGDTFEAYAVKESSRA